MEGGGGIFLENFLETLDMEELKLIIEKAKNILKKKKFKKKEDKIKEYIDLPKDWDLFYNKVNSYPTVTHEITLIHNKKNSLYQ